MQLKRVELLNVIIIFPLFCLGQILSFNNKTRVKRAVPDLSVFVIEAAAQASDALDKGAAFKKNYSIEAGGVKFEDNIKFGFGRAMDDPSTESAERRKRSADDDFETEVNFQRNDVRQKRSLHPNPSIFTSQLINLLSGRTYRTKRQAEMPKDGQNVMTKVSQMFNDMATIFSDLVNKVKSLVGSGAGGIPQSGGAGSNGAAVAS